MNALMQLKLENKSGGVTGDESRRQCGSLVAKGLECHAQDFEHYSVAHRCLNRKQSDLYFRKISVGDRMWVEEGAQRWEDWLGLSSRSLVGVRRPRKLRSSRGREGRR